VVQEYQVIALHIFTSRLPKVPNPTPQVPGLRSIMTSLVSV
jgi:hypothetical protein